MTKKSLTVAIEEQRSSVDAARQALEAESQAKLPPSSAGTLSGLPRPNIIDDLPLFVACFT
jgi:hypothetical protein